MSERVEQFTSRRTEAIPGFIWIRKGQSKVGHYGKWLWQEGPFLCVFVSSYSWCHGGEAGVSNVCESCSCGNDLCAALGPAQSDSTSLSFRLALHFVG